LVTVIGIPAYNEEKNIASIIMKLKKITDHIIVCNDGSTDMTEEISKELNVVVINHSRNMGYGSAIRSIFLKAKELQADILVTFDADGQHRVVDVQSVTKPIIDNKADIVIGSRFLENKSDIPEYRKLGIKIITKITNSSLKEKLTDSQSGFRAYSKNVLKNITPSESGMGVSTEILIKASSAGHKIAEVPITIMYGSDTSTHNPVSHGTSVLFSSIKFTSIEHPLKFYGIPAIIFLGIGFVFMLWTFQIYAIEKEIITNVALIGIGSLVIGIVFLLTAILLYSLVSVVRERNTR
jgi:glycosyltransferase involved in cell wall biosynthesis|tara:strand:+ start:765 stop:1649 length:885 start_codon:yes stop_codon:yes gene_type:complete